MTSKVVANIHSCRANYNNNFTGTKILTFKDSSEILNNKIMHTSNNLVSQLYVKHRFDALFLKRVGNSNLIRRQTLT